MRDGASGVNKAGGSARAWMVLLLTTVLALGADLASKHVAFERIAGVPVVVDRQDVLDLGPARIGELIPAHRPVVVVPKVLELTLVLNPGAVFGIGAGKRWFFVVFTVFALGAGVALFARGTRADQPVAHAAIGLLIAGGLGNLYDRLTYGCVRDFLHPLPGVKWPFGISEKPLWPYVSNVADAWLLVGIGVLIVVLWRSDTTAKEGSAGVAR